jgi:hypothetical protein
MPPLHAVRCSLRRFAAALVIGAALLPAVCTAGERDGSDGASAPSVLEQHGWRFVPLSQMLEHSQRERLTSRGMPRLLPLAMMPMHQSALWLGLSSVRGEGERASGVRFELRWSIPLDRIGGGVELPALAMR